MKSCYEQENPKLVRAMKEGKAPLDYLVTSCWADEAWVLHGGAEKYGRYNWREDKIKYSTYKGAILRHLFAFFDQSEDLDPESHRTHLAHIRACCAVLHDAIVHGTAIDDRQFKESKDATINKS